MRLPWKDTVAALAAGGVMAAYVAAAIAGLITGDNTALAVLMAATIAAWLVATALHTLTTQPRPGPAPGRDTHEVIHPEKMTVHQPIVQPGGHHGAARAAPYQLAVIF